jgi:hypothetical protein
VHELVWPMDIRTVHLTNLGFDSGDRTACLRWMARMMAARMVRLKYLAGRIGLVVCAMCEVGTSRRTRHHGE